MNQVRVLYMLLVLSLGGMGAWVWKSKQEERAAEEALIRAVDMQEAKLAARKQETERALADQKAEYEDKIKQLNDAHAKDLEDIRKSERERMAQAFSQFGDILDGNKKTLDYINLIEQKVKSGQEVSKAEAQKLAVIATGLSYLQQQYKKPFREFTELETYLANRAGVTLTEPDQRFSFFKRMFSKEYREQEKEFHRTEGEKRAFQEASDKFGAAYSAAQKQMAAANIDFEKSMAQLNALAQEKKPEDLSEFFSKAKKSLSTHQKLLDFEPEPTTPAPKPGEGPRP
jgi:hypothetical protein